MAAPTPQQEGLYSQREIEELHSEGRAYSSVAYRVFEQIESFFSPSSSQFRSDKRSNAPTGASYFDSVHRSYNVEGPPLLNRAAELVKSEAAPSGKNFFEIRLRDESEALLRADVRNRLAAELGAENVGSEEFEKQVEMSIRQGLMAVKSIGQRVTMTVHSHILAGGFMPSLLAIIRSMLTYGNAIFAINNDPVTGEVIVRSVPLGSVVIPSSGDEPTTPIIFVNQQMRPADFVKTYKAFLSPEAIERAEQVAKAKPGMIDGTRTKPFILFQGKRSVPLPVGAKYQYQISAYMDGQVTGAPLFTILQDEPIFHHARLYKIDGHSWGGGLGHQMVGQAAIESAANEHFLEAADLLVRPPLLIDETLWAKRGLLRANAAIAVQNLNPQQPPVMQAQMVGDTTGVLAALQKATESQKTTCHYVPPVSEAEKLKGITATQWESHIGVDAQTRGSLLEAVEIGVLLPVVRTAYNDLIRRGTIATAISDIVGGPERAAEYIPNIQYGGPYELKFAGQEQSILRAKELRKIMVFAELAPQLGIDPSIHLNDVELIQQLVDGIGMSRKVLLSPDRVLEKKRRMLEEMQRQQALEAQAQQPATPQQQ